MLNPDGKVWPGTITHHRKDAIKLFDSLVEPAFSVARKQGYRVARVEVREIQ